MLQWAKIDQSFMSELEPTLSNGPESNRAELFRQRPDIQYDVFDDGDEDFPFEVPLMCDARTFEKDTRALQQATEALADPDLYLVLDRSRMPEVWQMIVEDAKRRLQAAQAVADELGLGDVGYDFPEPNWPEVAPSADDERQARAQTALHQSDYQWAGTLEGNVDDLLRTGSRPWATTQLADLLVSALAAVKAAGE